MRLQSERLVLSTALRGFSVSPFVARGNEDATETRILIECEALRRSMRDGDDDWEAASSPPSTRSACKSSGKRDSAGKLEAADLTAMEERHHQFHRALIAHCGSPRLLEMADQLYVETQRYRLPSLVGRVAGRHRATLPPSIRRSWMRRCAVAKMPFVTWPSITGARLRSSRPRSNGLCRREATVGPR